MNVLAANYFGDSLWFLGHLAEGSTFHPNIIRRSNSSDDKICRQQSRVWLGGLGFLENEVIQKFLLIFYSVFLVVYMEISSGVIRFSMLDTSIRRRGVRDECQKYLR